MTRDIRFAFESQPPRHFADPLTAASAVDFTVYIPLVVPDGCRLMLGAVLPRPDGGQTVNLSYRCGGASDQPAPGNSINLNEMRSAEEEDSRREAWTSFQEGGVTLRVSDTTEEAVMGRSAAVSIGGTLVWIHGVLTLAEVKQMAFSLKPVGEKAN